MEVTYEEKVFGIGLSRTGTTSLTSAMRILGYKSKHYPAYYLNSFFKISINESELKAYKCLTDVPVAHNFKELDRRYPHAKFILTMRDENTWLESVKRFFTRPEGNRSNGHIKDILRCLKPKNKLWRNNYILRCLVYGSFKFNEKSYLKGYRKHNKEVIDYFEGDTDKLLVLNLIKEEDKWEKLCGFLDEEIPDSAFPHKNNSGSK